MLLLGREGRTADLQYKELLSYSFLFGWVFFLLAKVFVAVLKSQNCRQHQPCSAVWLRKITGGFPGPQIRSAIALGERSSMLKRLSKRQIH